MYCNYWQICHMVNWYAYTHWRVCSYCLQKSHGQYVYLYFSFAVCMFTMPYTIIALLLYLHNTDSIMLSLNMSLGCIHVLSEHFNYLWTSILLVQTIQFIKGEMGWVFNKQTLFLYSDLAEQVKKCFLDFTLHENHEL